MHVRENIGAADIELSTGHYAALAGLIGQDAASPSARGAGRNGPRLVNR
jgi:hypothetical protein